MAEMAERNDDKQLLKIVPFGCIVARVQLDEQLDWDLIGWCLEGYEKWEKTKPSGNTVFQCLKHHSECIWKGQVHRC